MRDFEIIPSKGVPVDRFSPEKRFVDRIVGEASVVVAVGVAAGDAVCPLCDEIRQAVGKLTLLTTLGKTTAYHMGAFRLSYFVNYPG